MAIKSKNSDWMNYWYIIPVIIIFYVVTRFIFGSNKNVEGFSMSDSWKNILMFFYDFWYAIYQFWKNVINFWLNKMDDFFTQWKNSINY
jgi:hypothetical protein